MNCYLLQDTDMNTLLGGVQQTYLFDLLLEIKRDNEEFPVYAPGGRLNLLYKFL